MEGVVTCSRDALIYRLEYAVGTLISLIEDPIREELCHKLLAATIMVHERGMDQCLSSRKNTDLGPCYEHHGCAQSGI